MSTHTNCCSGKALKLTYSQAANGLTKSCSTNPNDELCAEVQALVACAPTRFVEPTNCGSCLKILNPADTLAKYKNAVRDEFSCPGALVTTGIKSYHGLSNCIKVDVSKRADGTDAKLADALANCDTTKAGALVVAKAASQGVGSGGCKSCH